MNKKELSERDICTKFITPALIGAKWDVMNQIREEVYFTKGRVIVRGQLSTRGEPKRADYDLDVKNPHTVDDAHRDPAELLAEYQKAQAAVAEVREKLRKELETALAR